MSTYKKKQKKEKPLTGKDLVTADPNNPLFAYGEMISSPVYEYRIKEKLYAEKMLSAKGFVNNDYIYDIPGISKRGEDGVIMMHGILVEELVRYELCKLLSTSGSILLATLVELDDKLYETIQKTTKELGPEADVFEEKDVKNEAERAFNDMILNSLDVRISTFITEHDEVKKIILG